MTAVSHQTIKLSRGKHRSPHSGACVMELASMLAGEPFSDHPACASRVIGAFLRAYNDHLDDERRQDLYAYAAKVVDTADSAAVEEARLMALLEWADGLWEKRARRSILERYRRHRIRHHRRGALEETARYAIAAVSPLTDSTHGEVLALLDELISLRSRGMPVSTQVTPAAWASTA